MKPNIKIFTDGSCPVPNSAGGWAYIMRLDNGTEKRLSGGSPRCTNNQMELEGVLQALRILPCPCELTITSDSQYVVNGINDWSKKWKKKGWKKLNYETKKLEEPANLEQWKEMDKLLAGHEYKAVWVRGHNGHPENEWCDMAAGLETKKIIEAAGA